MSRELLIVRHGKSDWSTPELTDFERPLKKKGIAASQKMGKFLYSQGLIPDYIVSSTAMRAMETAIIFAKSLGLTSADIHYDSELYLCELHTVMKILENIPATQKRVMIVGHNPSLDYIVTALSNTNVKDREDGKIMTTAAVAHLAMPEFWCPLNPHCADLINLWRPGDLD